MLIIPGIIASSITRSKLSSYESIATVTVGAGGSSTATFSSIPQTYKHLQLRVMSKNTSADYSLWMRANSDSGNNYFHHVLSGNGTSATASNAGSATNVFQIYTQADTTANVFGGCIIDILDYTNTNKYKTVRSLGGFDKNASGGYIQLTSSLWMNSAAITQLDLLQFTGNFAQYSSFALYGVKG